MPSTEKTAAALLAAGPTTLTHVHIDDLVGAFPGVGACTEGLSEDARGHLVELPLTAVAHWTSAPAALVQQGHACSECARHHRTGGDPRFRSACPNVRHGECDYGYIAAMATSLRRGEPLDPVVVYHKPWQLLDGHVDTACSQGTREFAVDDGYHRLSAHRMLDAASVPALVFHEPGCCPARPHPAGVAHR